ncbi:hypothetical protein B0H19DRAFT_1276536 [Mycena capillaripes]|nr:hypothetical protein B0H19DRAFT_1276536 [Mycena capillaripes]
MLVIWALWLNVNVALGLFILTPGTLQSGQNALLTWTHDSSDTTQCSFKIAVASASLHSDTTLASEVNCLGDKITVHIPNLQSSNDYTVVFTKDDGTVTQSNTFSITGSGTGGGQETSSSPDPPQQTPIRTSSPVTSSSTAQVHSGSSIPVTQPSPTSTSGSSSSIPVTQPPSSGSITPTQPPSSAIRATKKSLSAGSIAGIAFVALSVPVVAFIIVFCLRRRKRHPTSMRPEVYINTTPDLERGTSRPHSIDHKSPSLEMTPTSVDATSPGTQSEGSTAQLRAVHAQLTALKGAMVDGDSTNLAPSRENENEALRARIRALEDQLELQGNSRPLSDHPPPAYGA